MVDPLTPKSTRKVETLVRVSPIIASSREGDDVVKEVTLPVERGKVVYELLFIMNR